jgi:hypothetical protein
MDNKMDFASQNLTVGQLNAIVKKLGGEEGAMQFLRGEKIVSATARAWKTWKTIKLGTGLKTADDFRKALKASGFRIGDYANDILGKPAFIAAVKETEMELVKASVGELGFKNGANQQEIYQKAQELGLKLCPNEVGPQLRLQYPDQPNGEWLVIAMEPIAVSVGFLRLFYVWHADDDQWLNSSYDYPDNSWSAGSPFVFCK